MPIVQQGTSSSVVSASSQGLAIDNILSRLERECGDKPPDAVLSLRWLEDRYRQVWSATDWPFAIKSGTLQTVAKITAGTVTVTNGSTTVTETVTDENGWSSDVEGRYFRVAGDNTFYQIDAYTNSDPDTLTLALPYEGTTTTDISYTIFQNIYSLGTDVGRLEGMSNLNSRLPLREVNQEWIDLNFPNREDYGEPRLYAVAGRDANEIYQVELYYIPSTVQSIQYRYIQEAPYLTSGSTRTVPQIFDSLLRHGWKADYWRWRGGMDDATGQEQSWSIQEETLFAKELSEMCAREAQNRPPQKMRLAERYIRHRFYRSSERL